MMHAHIKMLKALERNIKLHAERAMMTGPAAFTSTLSTLDQRVERAELLHAIGDACGRAAMDLEAEQKDLERQLERRPV